jgi:hypothetical protein
MAESTDVQVTLKVTRSDNSQARPGTDFEDEAVRKVREVLRNTASFVKTEGWDVEVTDIRTPA